MLTDALIEQILTALPGKTIGVLGDLFLDRYLDIDAALTEPSIETGLDAYQVVRVRSYPGAAGTVINNLAALGVGRIVPISLIGDDGEGYELLQALGALHVVRIETLISSPLRRTPTYTKPMLHESGKQARELNRIDIKNRSRTPPESQEALATQLASHWPSLDALIVVDQVSEEDCGVVTAGVRSRLEVLARSEPSRFVLADSRARIGSFHAVCLKPNRRECAAAAGVADSAWIEGAAVLRASCGRAVFATAAEEGTYLIDPAAQQPMWIRAYPVTGPVDSVGAGDSCSAGIACAVAGGVRFPEAAAFGNLIASITVQQLGVTGTASPGQVRERWREVSELGK